MLRWEVRFEYAYKHRALLLLVIFTVLHESHLVGWFYPEGKRPPRLTHHLNQPIASKFNSVTPVLEPVGPTQVL